MKSHHLSHDDYTVGWICALPLEMAAAKAMLDLTHPKLMHNKTNDLRLGDVVVSQPSGSSGGVMQYDHGKTITGGVFQPTGMMNKPPPVLLSALSNLQSEEVLGRSPLKEILSEALQRYAPISHFTYPGPQQDILFRADYPHPSSTISCDECDHDMQIFRRERTGPRVFYGLIASANQVMKDSITRDWLAREHNIACFEMEAAGLMDNFPCLVIRGICDYSDSHKHKQWQGYAALTAAAYAKCVLLMASVTSTKMTGSISNDVKKSKFNSPAYFPLNMQRSNQITSFPTYRPRQRMFNCTLSHRSRRR